MCMPMTGYMGLSAFTKGGSAVHIHSLCVGPRPDRPKHPRVAFPELLAPCHTFSRTTLSLALRFFVNISHLSIAGSTNDPQAVVRVATCSAQTF